MQAQLQDANLRIAQLQWELASQRGSDVHPGLLALEGWLDPSRREACTLHGSPQRLESKDVGTLAHGLAQAQGTRRESSASTVPRASALLSEHGPPVDGLAGRGGSNYRNLKSDATASTNSGQVSHSGSDSGAEGSSDARGMAWEIARRLDL